MDESAAHGDTHRIVWFGLAELLAGPVLVASRTDSQEICHGHVINRGDAGLEWRLRFDEIKKANLPASSPKSLQSQIPPGQGIDTGPIVPEVFWADRALLSVLTVGLGNHQVVYSGQMRSRRRLSATQERSLRL